MARLRDRLLKLERAAAPEREVFTFPNSCGWASWSHGQTWEEYRAERLAELRRARDDGRQIMRIMFRGIGDRRMLDIWREAFPNDGMSEQAWGIGGEDASDHAAA